MANLSKIFILGLVICAFAAPSIAQDNQPSSSATPSRKSNSGQEAKPISQIELDKLAAVGTITACENNIRNKIAIKDALPTSAIGVAWVIDKFHGGLIEGNPNKIATQQLFVGSYVQILGATKNICYENFSAADKKFVDDEILKINDQMKSQQKTSK